MGFDPYNGSLKNSGVHRESNSQSGSSFGSVRVHSLTLSYILGSIRCASQASLLSCTFVSPCLGREPNARVVTFSPTKEEVNVLIDTQNLFLQCNCFHLDPWPSIVDFCDMTLPQVNLGVPKFPTLSWQIKGGFIKNL